MNCTTLSAWKDEKNLSDISFLQVYEFEAIFDALWREIQVIGMG